MFGLIRVISVGFGGMFAIGLLTKDLATFIRLDEDPHEPNPPGDDQYGVDVLEDLVRVARVE